MTTEEILKALGKSAGMALIASTTMSGLVDNTRDAIRYVNNENNCSPAADLIASGVMFGATFCTALVFCLSFFHHKAKRKEALLDRSNNAPRYGYNPID